MKAILSTTFDDKYLFYLPITAWSWNKLGIGVICFLPANGYKFNKKFQLVLNIIYGHDDLNVETVTFNCPENKTATYAQCARLYGGTLPIVNDDEVLVTGDIDMAVFNKDFFDQLNENRIHIVGTDLVPNDQYPICYISMSAEYWRSAMWIDIGQSHQEKLDALLGHLDCEHFAGNYWAKDQETAFNMIKGSGLPVQKHLRASPGTQFATQRADRDGWPSIIPENLIDAHLPRPGYTENNFSKILNLFQTMYPDDDFTWMLNYRNEFIKFIK